MRKTFSKCVLDVLFILLTVMHSEKNPDYKNRLMYGATVGAILGMIIGTMPTNDPRIGLLSMGLSAIIIAALALLSDSFWESLRAAWELMRMAFWRW